MGLHYRVKGVKDNKMFKFSPVASLNTIFLCEKATVCIENGCHISFSIQPPQEKVKKSVQGSTVISMASRMLAATKE